jgi:hypothetical protein
MSPQTAQTVTVSVPPDYPLLARQMKVQGAVILQALISKKDRSGTADRKRSRHPGDGRPQGNRQAMARFFKPYYQSRTASRNAGAVTR